MPESIRVRRKEISRRVTIRLQTIRGKDLWYGKIGQDGQESLPFP